jgi:phage portal protein BeeE
VNQTQPGQRQEPIGPAYRSLTDLAYKSDSVVFACMQTRARHFRQVRFQFRNRSNGKLYGNPDLQPLETPWPGATTADLLTRMILHADLGGNAFVVKRGDGLALLRPDWVTLVIGSDTDPELGAWATDAEILGYIYSPGGYGSDSYETEVFAPEDVAHFAPIPDPEARFRGMSWLTPLMREVMADKAATEHKLSFFQNPTPNMVVKFDVPDLDEFKTQIGEFKKAHMGPRNAYKYMFGTMGMDFTPVGANLKDLDYKMITGAGETRIASAAGTPRSCRFVGGVAGVGFEQRQLSGRAPPVRRRSDPRPVAGRRRVSGEHRERPVRVRALVLGPRRRVRERGRG